MSLRMNLYGFSLSAFTRVLGSKDAAVLDAATTRFAETVTKEPSASQGRAWLRTLIESGSPLCADRAPPTASDDGELLTVRMETEAHVFAVVALVRATAGPDHLDFALESSNWKHPSVGALLQDMSACGFTRSKSCTAQYLSWVHRLGHGSPLFGDDFRTAWSFYTVFSNQELAALVPVLQAASDFERSLPENLPEAIARTMKTRLSDDGRGFARDLVRWFGQIEQAGQDAFILWW